MAQIHIKSGKKSSVVKISGSCCVGDSMNIKDKLLEAGSSVSLKIVLQDLTDIDISFLQILYAFLQTYSEQKDKNLEIVMDDSGILEKMIKTYGFGCCRLFVKNLFTGQGCNGI